MLDKVSIKCLININQKLINQVNQKIRIELDQLNYTKR